MTFREKFEKEKPSLAERMKFPYYGCPHIYGYEEKAPCQDMGMSCEKCWEREIPETEKKTDHSANRYEKMAVELYGMYTAFRNSGFTDEQALELTKSMIAAGVALTKN